MMGRRLQLALLMTATAVVAAERPSIGILTEFSGEVSATVRQEFRAETERALMSAGVDAVWRNLGGQGTEEAFERLVVLRFRGDCQAVNAAAGRKNLPLGFTHVSNGKVLPFVEIDCRRVLEAMEAGQWQPRVRLPSAALGRALGRVAAHEIHHVLTGSGAHDIEGLMKRAFDWRDLCGLELNFSRESVRRLRIGLGWAESKTASRGRISTDD